LPGLAASDQDRQVLTKRARAVEGAGNAGPRGRVVLVDDEPLFRQALGQNLVDAGFDILEFDSGQKMLAQLKDGCEADLVILDWRMPEMNGIDVLKRLRDGGYEMPVMFLTGHSHVVYEEAALSLGAVDFIEKTRGFGILLRRAELSLKRARARRRQTNGGVSAAASGTLKFGDLDLLLDVNCARWKGQAVKLTLSEFKMVRLMAENAGQHVPYQQLYDLVPGKRSAADLQKGNFETNVRTFIKRIRRSFTDIDINFDRIENYAKFGYRWRVQLPAE
jgi:two-component system response regulator ChvI